MLEIEPTRQRGLYTASVAETAMKPTSAPLQKHSSGGSTIGWGHTCSLFRTVLNKLCADNTEKTKCAT